MDKKHFLLLASLLFWMTAIINAEPRIDSSTDLFTGETTNSVYVFSNDGDMALLAFSVNDSREDPIYIGVHAHRHIQSNGYTTMLWLTDNMEEPLDIYGFISSDYFGVIEQEEIQQYIATLEDASILNVRLTSWDGRNYDYSFSLDGMYQALRENGMVIN